MRLGKSSTETGGAAFQLEKIWEEVQPGFKLGWLGLLVNQLRQAVQGMTRSALTSFLTLLTVALSLSLPGGGMLLLENSSKYIKMTRDKLTVSVYLRDGAEPRKVKQLREQFLKFPKVSQAVFLDKGQVLEDFRRSLGEQSVILDGLEQSNPLPAMFEVSFADGDERVFDEFSRRFSLSEVVEQVQFNRGLLGQLGAAMISLRRAGWLLIAVILLIVSFIVANTIKLSVYSRRDEIEIMKLVGASDFFVWVPFVAEGVILCGVGGALSIGVVYLFFTAAREIVSSSSLFQLIFPDLHFLTGISAAIVLAAGIVVGLLGSFFAIRKFRIE